MSSPMGEAGPARSFQSRLNRVERARAPSEARKPAVSVLPDWKRDLARKSGIPAAILCGMVSVLVVRVIAFHTTGNAMISSTPDLTMALETAAAIALGLLFFTFLPFRGLATKLAQIAAVAVTITAMHNAVHAAPGLFSLLFSPVWAAEVTAGTEPRSILIRGEVIPLTAPLEDEEEEKVLPTILRLD